MCLLFLGRLHSFCGLFLYLRSYLFLRSSYWLLRLSFYGCLLWGSTQTSVQVLNQSKTSPPSAREAAMNATHMNVFWNTLKVYLKLPWNTLETPLKHPWNFLFHETFMKHPRNIFEPHLKLPQNTLQSPSKHPSIFLESFMKHPCNFFKTPLKLPQNSIETSLKHP